MANQKTESFVYHWLRAHASCDVTYSPGICQSIGRYFKRSVDMVMYVRLQDHGKRRF